MRSRTLFERLRDRRAARRLLPDATEGETPERMSAGESSAATSRFFTPPFTGTFRALAAPENIARTPQEAAQKLLQTLNDYLPAPLSGMPAPGVTVVNVVERALGIGNRRGYEQRGPLIVAELKGGRLEALVRFQLWDDEASDVEAAGFALQQALLAARDDLWNRGVLRLTLVDGPLAERPDNVAAWRKVLDCRILYEYIFVDDDAARGLIARIPTDMGDMNSSDSGGLPAPMLVSLAEFALWDDMSAPVIRSNRQGVVRGLYAAAFLPLTWAGGSPIRLTAVVNGQPWEKIYANMLDFWAAFVPDSDSIVLNNKAFQTGLLPFQPPDFPEPILLNGGSQEFRVIYDAPQLDDPDAAIYLKLLVE